MLHVSDILLLRLKRAPYGLDAGMNHGLSLNDFYVHKGVKLGNVHAHSIAVARETIVAFLRLHMKRLNRLPEFGLSALAAIGSYFHRSSAVFATVLEDLPYEANRVRTLPGPGDRVQFVAGGETRLQSVINAMKAAGGDYDIVAIHDAVRPFFRIDTLTLLIDAAREHGGAVPALPITDTIHATRDEAVSKLGTTGTGPPG